MRFNFISTYTFPSSNLDCYFYSLWKNNKQSLHYFGYVNNILFKANSTKVLFSFFFFPWSLQLPFYPLRTVFFSCVLNFFQNFSCINYIWSRSSSFIFSEDILLRSPLVQCTARRKMQSWDFPSGWRGFHCFWHFQALGPVACWRQVGFLFGWCLSFLMLSWLEFLYSSFLCHFFNLLQGSIKIYL